VGERESNGESGWVCVREDASEEGGANGWQIVSENRILTPPPNQLVAPTLSENRV